MMPQSSGRLSQAFLVGIFSLLVSAPAGADPKDSIEIDVKGRVIRPDSQPLAGAALSVAGFSTTSDGQGRFQIRGRMPAGIRPGASAGDPGMRIRQGRLHFSNRGGAAEIAVSLARLDGHVLVTHRKAYGAGPQSLDLRALLPRTGYRGPVLLTFARGREARTDLIGATGAGFRDRVLAPPGTETRLRKAAAPAALDSLKASKPRHLTRWVPLAAYVADVGDIVLQPESLPLVPWPQAVLEGQGRLQLPPSARILVTDTALAQVAAALAREIEALTGKSYPVALAPGAPGEIILTLDPGLAGAFPSSTVVNDRVTVTGKEPYAAALGAANILQLLGPDGSLPRVSLADNTPTRYSELMLDVARQFNAIDVLKRCVVLCRLYKIPFFRLHLTDDQLWMFPSAAYPELGQGNPKGAAPYTRAQLADLVAFARDRGVRVIPEVECLGHSTAMRRDRPDLFGTADGAVLQANLVASEKYYAAMETLFRELAEVFHTSPYIHIGDDEAGMGTVMRHPDAQAYLAARGIATERQLWVDHLTRLNALVKGVGRKTMVWEGFSRAVGQDLSPKSDFLLFAWDGKFYPPKSLQADGFAFVNVPWNPSVYSTEAENYAWNLWLVGSNERTPDQFAIGDPSVVGGSMVLWERPGGEAIPMLRFKTPARQERIYNPSAHRSFADFQARCAGTDTVLQKLFQTVGTNPVPSAFVIPSGTRNFGRRHVDSGATPPIEFRVVNNGDADMTVHSFGLTGIANTPYLVIHDTGEKLLRPGKARTLQVVYDPFPDCNSTSNYVEARTDDPAAPTVRTYIIAGADQ